MALRLDDHWLWDFWLVDDGDRFHLFHLQAPRSLPDPDMRHFNVSIGHATSTDLRSWDHHGTVLAPANEPAWDDAATWTGSVVPDPRGGWAMLYTGASRSEDGLVQRIGLATSTDLHTWTRHGANPLFEADARWYERLDESRWHDEAWRDPWVMPDPDGDGWHALVTARVTTGPTEDAGVLGHAWSPDLVTWEVRPPLTEPSGVGHLEVPQVIETAAGHLLVFSYEPSGIPRARRSTRELVGSYVVPLDGPLGPVELTRPIRIGQPGSYSNKIVADRTGELVVLGFDNRPGASFGTLTDPTPLESYLPR